MNNAPNVTGTVSGAATVCPHCGYPLLTATTQPADPNGADATLDALGPELAGEIRAALQQAGLADAKLGQVTVGKPVVTTRLYTATAGDPPAAATPQPPRPPLPPWAGAYGYDYRSKWTLLGLPLLAMSQGYDPATGRKRVAKGWVAIGDVAVGGLAIGGAAFGVVCLGGLAVGLVSLGGLAVGLAVAVGGGAIGTVAVGGAAVGIWAAGGGAFGLHVLSPMTMR